MLQIIGSIAEFERSIMLSRQLEGIAKAKAEGKYRGGIPTARAKAEQVFALVQSGKTRAEAAQELGISIRSVFRILRTRKDAEKAPVAPACHANSDTSALIGDSLRFVGRGHVGTISRPFDIRNMIKI
jgi:DNA invertase Pin-like site-specific DNA recombinase